MKKLYYTPEAEVIAFSVKEVILTDPGADGSGVDLPESVDTGDF